VQIRQFDDVRLGFFASASLQTVKGVNTTGYHLMPCCVHWPAVLRRICTSAFCPWGWQSVHHYSLRRPHDAVGTRLAVCVRLCSCLRIRSTGVCVGVPAEKSQLSAGLPCCRSSYPTDRKISCSLGTTLSLSIRSCRQTPLRSFGCRSLIRPRFSSSRPKNPSLVHAPFVP
jgi:hypothetical protein